MGKPLQFIGDVFGNAYTSEPREVKHLSTERKREQYECRSVRALCLCEWNATLVIPVVAASEMGRAQTCTFGCGGCRVGATDLSVESYQRNS